MNPNAAKDAQILMEEEAERQRKADQQTKADEIQLEAQKKAAAEAIQLEMDKLALQLKTVEAEQTLLLQLQLEETVCLQEASCLRLRLEPEGAPYWLQEALNNLKYDEEDEDRNGKNGEDHRDRRLRECYERHVRSYNEGMEMLERHYGNMHISLSSNILSNQAKERAQFLSSLEKKNKKWKLEEEEEKHRTEQMFTEQLSWLQDAVRSLQETPPDVEENQEGIEKCRELERCFRDIEKTLEESCSTRQQWILHGSNRQDPWELAYYHYDGKETDWLEAKVSLSEKLEKYEHKKVKMEKAPFWKVSKC